MSRTHIDGTDSIICDRQDIMTKHYTSITIAHWLAHGHDVRHDVISLEHPEVAATASKPRLNLIRDHNSPMAAH